MWINKINGCYYEEWVLALASFLGDCQGIISHRSKTRYHSERNFKCDRSSCASVL